MLAAERPQPRFRCVPGPSVRPGCQGEGNSRIDGSDRSCEVRMIR
jgi:hypothetical protein